MIREKWHDFVSTKRYDWTAGIMPCFRLGRTVWHAMALGLLFSRCSAPPMYYKGRNCGGA
jgi:hypothetical protein